MTPARRTALLVLATVVAGQLGAFLLALMTGGWRAAWINAAVTPVVALLGLLLVEYRAPILARAVQVSRKPQMVHERDDATRVPIEAPRGR